MMKFPSSFLTGIIFATALNFATPRAQAKEFNINVNCVGTFVEENASTPTVVNLRSFNRDQATYISIKAESETYEQMELLVEEVSKNRISEIVINGKAVKPSYLQAYNTQFQLVIPKITTNEARFRLVINEDATPTWSLSCK